MSTGCLGALQCRCSPTLVAACGLCTEGRALIQRRLEGVPCRGLRESPGNTVEPSETPEETLRRETEEEIGIAIHRADPVSFATDAPNHLVLLLFACMDWAGDPEGREGQMTKCVLLSHLHEMLPLDETLVLPLREFVMGM